jgi:hypothetical protein
MLPKVLRAATIVSLRVLTYYAASRFCWFSWLTSCRSAVHSRTGGGSYAPIWSCLL